MGEGGAAAGGESARAEDAKFLEVLEYALSVGKVSTSSVQRQFCLGFNRAARMIDRMTELGFLSPADGAKPREVRITMEQFWAIKNNHDSGNSYDTVYGV